MTKQTDLKVKCDLLKEIIPNIKDNDTKMMLKILWFNYQAELFELEGCIKKC